MQAVWNNVKDVLKERIPAHSYQIWIEPIQFLEFNDNCMILSCPNAFYKKKIHEHYMDMIMSEMASAYNCPCRIDFQITKAQKNLSCLEKSIIKPDPQLKLPTMNMPSFYGRQLRRDFTFDQFVVSNSNDFAYSAALSMASNKLCRQQSILLLSKTGMGKSHLSQAVGHHILNKFPSEKVYYITAEDFMNEMVQGIKHNETDKFKQKYRDECDVLLLEDVQYLSGKDRTQDELSLSLDFLFSMDKKVIFSSCYSPADIPKLNDKLRSHFSSSIITNIEAPCYRTRVRILQKKAQLMGYFIPEGVIEYLASELTEDVRQLESGLTGIVAKASLLGSSIDLKLAESVIKNIVRIRKNITIETIKKLICKHYSITIKDVMSNSRKQCYTRPRQIAIYLSRKYTDSPLQTIGKSFNRYHATALHAINSIEREIKENPDLKKQVIFLCEKLESGKI
jgi:chromosomal replication initiator protein